MAIKPDNIRTEAATLCVSGSAKGSWVTANRDARTAQAAAVLCAPASVATTTPVDWVKVSVGVTRVLIQARFPKATASVATSPVVRVFGAIVAGGDIAADGTVPQTGTVRIIRLDTVGFATAGQTLTLGVSTTANSNDSTYWYSNPIDLTGYDIMGSDYVAVFVETAAAITATDVVEIQVLLLN